MDTINKLDLETLISITGASEAVGTRLLQANGGDLNAAVNAYFNDGDVPEPVRDRNNYEQDDYMDEDEPAIGIPIAPTVSRGPLEQFSASRWNDADLRSSRLPFEGSTLSSFLGDAPRVAHPREVREIPVEWREDDNSLPQSTFGTSTVRIEELPEDTETQHFQRVEAQVMVDDDDIPSTAVRSTGDQSGRRRYGNLPYSGQNMDFDVIPSAPRIAEVSAVHSGDGIDIEEEMLRAAIEASKREAEEASERSNDVSQDATVGNFANTFPERRATENDDLARAVTLSLKTAEQEKAMRERLGASSGAVVVLDDDEDRQNDNIRRREAARDRVGVVRGMPLDVGTATSSRDKCSGSSTGAIISSASDDAEEVEEQPLLRRKTSRRPVHVTSEAIVLPDDERPTEGLNGRGMAEQRTSIFPASAQTLNSTDDGPYTTASVPSQRDVDPFPSDEWGGISSEEHDEAVMLEAAIFGGLPEGSGLALPYHGRRVQTDVFDDIMGDESSSFTRTHSRRGFPQPPSPSVVAQRLLREQQDDEYLASLAADREKELKAIQEAEAQRLKDEEAVAAAEFEERQRLKEESRQRAEAEELERQLNAKKGKLPVEPAPDNDGAVTLFVRLPDGSRRGRRFLKSNKLQNLFDFIDVGGGVIPGSYRLVRQFPRVAFTDAQHSSSLESLGLTSRQEVLVLELI